MFLPIRTDSPLRSTPYMNWALIVANVVMYTLQKTMHLDGLVLHPADPHWYQYITYAFLHANAMHIFGNMLFLWIFGNNVCDKMGSIAYLGFYLGGAVFSGACHLLLSDAGVLGASGAVSAVTGAYLVLFPRSHVTVAYLLFFFGLIEIPSFYLIVFYFMKDLLYGLMSLEGMQEAGVAYMAHVAGTVFGFSICMLLLAGRLLPRDQFDVLALFDRWNRRRQYRDATARGWNPFDVSAAQHSTPTPLPPSPHQQRIGELRGEISSAISDHNMDLAARKYLQLRALDPTQVMPRQAQLDIANQLAGQQMYAEAAEAYEAFIRTYPKFEQMEQVELMLGLIYARYLQQPPKAREFLVRALAKLRGEKEINMAKSELTRIEMGMAGLG